MLYDLVTLSNSELPNKTSITFSVILALGSSFPIASIIKRRILDWTVKPSLGSISLLRYRSGIGVGGGSVTSARRRKNALKEPSASVNSTG